MALSLEQIRDVHVVRVQDAKLTYPVLTPFFAEARRIVEAGARKLVIELGAVSYIDSAAIGCLMDVYRLLEGRGGAMKLSGLQPRVETMLAMVGVTKLLDIHREEAAAVAAFRPRRRRRAHAPRPVPELDARLTR